MKEFKNFTEFRTNMHLIPEIVALDTLVRINDWILSGGTLDDSYVIRKLQYASRFISKEN